jgi:hypothetical protein
MAETFLVEEVRPDDQAAVGGEALVGERNPMDEVVFLVSRFRRTVWCASG